MGVGEVGTNPVADWRTCDCGWQRAYYRDLREQRDAVDEVAAERDRYSQALRAMARRLVEERAEAKEDVAELTRLLNTEDLKYQRGKRFQAERERDRLAAVLRDIGLALTDPDDRLSLLGALAVEKGLDRAREIMAELDQACARQDGEPQ